MYRPAAGVTPLCRRMRPWPSFASWMSVDPRVVRREPGGPHHDGESHRERHVSRATLKLDNMPPWLCSAIWQCAIHIG